MRKTILIVEDDLILNEVLYDNFQEEYRVLTAFDGEEALELFDQNNIDLVILDVMIPQIDGLAVCKKMRKSSDSIIVIVSARVGDDDKLLGYDLGADDYVEKPVKPSVLMAKVKVLLGRFNRSTSMVNLLEYSGIIVDKENHIVKVDKCDVTLTPKEFELLIMLIEHKDKVLSRSRLLDNIWGYDYYGDDRVVDTKIKTLRKKLGEKSKLIHTVFGVGYKFGEIDE